MNFRTKIICITFLTTTCISHARAIPNNQFYGSVQGGIFQARFNSNYLDQTDVIPQNISNSLTQNGYTGGLAVGYTRLLGSRYLFNLELAGNLDGNSALYQSGAANTAFSDKIELNHHIDLSVAPGIITASDFFPYLKLGVSYASVRDYVSSPVGYDPIMMQYNSNKNIWGLVAGLGMKYRATEHVGIFAEADYHDYGTLNLSPFQNFSANYTHSARIFSYSIVVGATYAFNI